MVPESRFRLRCNIIHSELPDCCGPTHWNSWHTFNTAVGYTDAAFATVSVERAGQPICDATCMKCGDVILQPTSQHLTHFDGGSMSMLPPCAESDSCGIHSVT
jgi:hypothetical protein